MSRVDQALQARRVASRRRGRGARRVASSSARRVARGRGRHLWAG